MKVTDQYFCHGGSLKYIEHEATTTKCTMRFSIFLPPHAETQSCPTLFYLAGLTCSPDNFTTKANAYRLAAELGIILVAPDTSPRGDDIPDIDEYDIAKGAGFYVNATQSPWKQNYQMEDYIAKELKDLVVNNFQSILEKSDYLVIPWAGMALLRFILNTQRYIRVPRHLRRSVRL